MPIRACIQSMFALALLAAGAASAATPMSLEQKDLTRLRVRHDMIGMVTSVCAGFYPHHGARYRSAFQTWGNARKPRLDLANKVLLTRNSRADAQETRALSELEKKALQAWQLGVTGAPLSRWPAIGDCDKLAAALPSLH
jgi:hypothetical protein